MVVQVEARHCFEEGLLGVLVLDCHAQVCMLEDAVLQGLDEGFCRTGIDIFAGEFIDCSNGEGIVES